MSWVYFWTICFIAGVLSYCGFRYMHHSGLYDMSNVMLESVFIPFIPGLNVITCAFMIVIIIDKQYMLWQKKRKMLGLPKFSLTHVFYGLRK
jgi:hypothetical protein